MLFRKNTLHTKVPNHIGIIMDGNGRWAKKHSLPRSAGHAAGAKTFKTITRYCNKIGVKYLTVYAFSTENWKRPKDEVDGIMNLLREYLKDAKNFKDENIKVRFIGDRESLSEDIIKLINENEEISKDATGLVLNIAFNYGGRAEIVNAVKRLFYDIKNGNLTEKDINEEELNRRMYTAEQDEPDFIIRPSGEYRLSNFLVWQSAYAEFWFSDVLWPDFTTHQLDRAIEDFNKRNRRFGGI